MDPFIQMLVLTVAIGAGVSLIGGIIGGMVLGGKHIGYELAGIMGGFFGPIAGLWGIAAGIGAVYILDMMGVMNFNAVMGG